MVADPIERMNYYQFQYVGAEDFRLQQAYHRDMRRRHNLGPHSWGIVSGCEIVETVRADNSAFVDIHVTPGIVVDGFGREIPLLEPTRVDPELFAAYNTDRHLSLWIRYHELPSRTEADGYAICINDNAASRVTESYRFVVEPLLQDRSELLVGGDIAKPAASAAPGEPVEPADGSIAYQDFPDEEAATNWPVRLGTVHWRGDLGKFEPVASPEKLVEGRYYAGFIGGSLLAEGQLLRIGPRTAFVPADIDKQAFATIEGRLKVDGRIDAQRDIHVNGGRIALLTKSGQDDKSPLWIQRLSPPSGPGADLRLHIGTAGIKQDRLTIGPGPTDTKMETEKVVLAVRADDRVDIPTGRLRFGAVGNSPSQQLIDLSIDTDDAIGPNGIGRQGSSTYHRSAASHYWYRGGDDKPGEGDPGTSGVVQMQLSGQGRLHFKNDVYRQVVNFDIHSQSSGIGVQQNTLYMRSAENFAWFRGGGHGSGVIDPGGGAVAMSLDSASRLWVEGGMVSKGQVELWGTALHFKMLGGGIDTDVMEISRFQHSSDNNDLRVTIGDNSGGDDRFVVGPRDAGDGQFKDNFVVDNRGQVRAKSDIYARNRNLLTEIKSGRIDVNASGNGDGSIRSGTETLSINRGSLQSIGEGHCMVALGGIRNEDVAMFARWTVESGPGTITNGGATIEFPINWSVRDIDGVLMWFNYIVILRGS
jgi:hypothetical protein